MRIAVNNLLRSGKLDDAAKCRDQWAKCET